jgi:putative hydrolase of the HAD superfamily
MNIKYIFFDCMETLIDMEELPNSKDYAIWSFEGSGWESYWGTFEEYFRDYENAREAIKRSLPEHKEYNLIERFWRIALLKFPNKTGVEIENITQLLFKNYWHNYKSRCYIKKDVKDTLSYLKVKYKLGVVSNFMVSGGIEELLHEHNISDYFDFIITSINIGWRKPHFEIYNRAILESQVSLDQIIFIGDDYLCDYEGAGRAGLKSILLDREKNISFTCEKINKLVELVTMF